VKPSDYDLVHLIERAARSATAQRPAGAEPRDGAPQPRKLPQAISPGALAVAARHHRRPCSNYIATVRECLSDAGLPESIIALASLGVRILLMTKHGTVSMNYTFKAAFGVIAFTGCLITGAQADLEGKYNPDTGTYQATPPTPPTPQATPIVTCGQLLGAARIVTLDAYMLISYASVIPREEAEGMLSEAKRAQAFVTNNIQQCHQPAFLNAISAYTTTTHALALKDLRMPWKTEMILGNQRLQTCVVEFYGTETSADCEEQIEHNIELSNRS
jgi:hypothetical protein